MTIIDPKKLDELIATSGVSPEVAAQLREGNGVSEPEKPRGHGAAAPATMDPVEI